MWSDKQATLHLVILLLAMILESYLRLNHRWRQQLGYLRFYRSTRHLLSIPFYAAAIATAALLLAELWPKAVCWLPQHTKLASLCCWSKACKTVLDDKPIFLETASQPK